MSGIGVSEWLRGLVVSVLEDRSTVGLIVESPGKTLASTVPRQAEKVERQEITLSNPQMSAYTS